MASTEPLRRGDMCFGMDATSTDCETSSRRVISAVTTIALMAGMVWWTPAVAFGGTSDCCVANGTPGCDCLDCETVVCAADSFCCDTQWDGICAGAAVDTLCVDLCAGGACGGDPPPPPPPGGGGWVDFTEQTAQRLSASSSLGETDPEEKDYAWGDLDKDGDTDLVCVRKQPFTSTGRKRNVLFMNEGTAEGHAVDGVLVDQTNAFAIAADDGGQGFLDLTNDRDVFLADVDGDTWLDIITATTLGDGLPKTISHPRVYRNLGAPGGVWAGFRYEEFRIPQLEGIAGNGFPHAPRFCSVAARDLTGDGAPDLYFGDYDSGGGQTLDFNNRLLINDGTGTFTDLSTSRMTSEMLLSAFGAASAIEDMNGDGVLDVVKQTALSAPQHIAVVYNDSASEGFFDFYDVVYSNAPYHVSVGDLNNDSMLDLVASDDGSDRYLLNQGNDAQGHADFTPFTFSFQAGGDDGFASNSLITDLNNDGWQDVLIADVDVDISGCSRRMHIYRNLAGTPGSNVTLQEQDPSVIPTGSLTGTHDVAAFDIDGDGWKDLVIGRCTGTQVWMNNPPTGVVFSYPLGLPGFVPPDATSAFQVMATPETGTIDSTSGKLFVSVDGGAFLMSSMTWMGGDTFQGTLPAAPCASRLAFYVEVGLVGGGTFLDPPTAPASTFTTVAATGTQITFLDEMEGDVSAWTVVNTALTSGAWEQAQPNGTVFNAQLAAPDEDATQALDAVMAFVTQNGPPGGSANADDVDGGPTHLISPAFDLAGTDATISWRQWFFSQTGSPDALDVAVSNDDGFSWTPVMSTTGTSSAWEIASFLVGDHITPTSVVRVRFKTSDNPSDSVTEGGVDNFQVEKFLCAGCVGPEDCNDLDACTTDSCDAGTCVNAPLDCDDLDPCTNDTCSAGVCANTPMDCDDLDPCTVDSCAAGVCQNPPMVCDDGDPCTTDFCALGVCDVAPLDCDDFDACTIDTCNGGVCANAPVDCDDLDPCTNDACVSGVCESSPTVCIDGDPCTLDSCVGGVCDFTAIPDCQPPLQPAMGEPVPGLTPDQLARFELGRDRFNSVLSEASGLGPIFNKDSCGGCHNAPLGGPGSIKVTRAGFADKGAFDSLDQFGGSLFQHEAIRIECEEVVPPEANIVAERVTPGMMGYGLVEAIPDAALLAFEDPADSDGDAISGRANTVESFEDPGVPRVGRFGWKAQVATILTFSADASLNEMGLTNRFLSVENDPNGIRPPNLGDPDFCDVVPDPEDSIAMGNGVDKEFIDVVTDFQRFLAAPPQTPRSGMTGESLFVSVGCADCHTPAYLTSGDPGLEPALSGKLVKPYSDLLLHDMGLAADGIAQGAAAELEIRTPPLMGLRVRDPMWHDGGVAAIGFESRILRAVAMHCAFGSEAQASAQRFLNGLVPGDCPECPVCPAPPVGGLTAGDRDAVLAFLDSLGRREFDQNGDNVIDLFDFFDFAACFGGGPYAADDPCAVFDVDQNGTADLDDFDLMLTVYSDPLADCNVNGTVDLIDILVGTSLDADADGVPDECIGGPIPTLSEWGVIVMSMLLLSAGTIVFRRRSPVRGTGNSE